MPTVRWRLSWVLLSAIAASAWACGDSADEPPLENGAGQADEAAAGAGAGGSAGAGGDTGAQCPGPQSLAELCSTVTCPETPDDVDLSYCDSPFDFPRVTRRESSCGGISVIASDSFSFIRYHFDADNHLVSVDGGGDDAGPCAGFTLGRECTLQGAETTLCGDLERCEALPLNDLCDEPDACSAFDSPQAIREQLCADGDTVERFDSSCEGYVYRRQSATTVSEWSFDTEGQLLGATITTETAEACADGAEAGYSKVAVYGDPCEPVGEGESVCDGQGGAGGRGGAGDQGGAPN